jgi:hypothetical protein
MGLHLRPHFHALLQRAFIIWQYDEPIDLFWCCGRHCTSTAVGFQTRAIGRNSIMSKNSGSVDVSYWESEGHIELQRGGRTALLYCFSGCNVQGKL